MRIFRLCTSKQLNRSVKSKTSSSYFCAVALLPLLASSSSSFVTAERLSPNRTYTSFVSSSSSSSSSFLHHHHQHPKKVVGTTSIRNIPSLASTTSTTMEVIQVPCLDDNYGYIIHDKSTGHTAVVDTPEAGPYQNEIAQRGWKLTHIFNTHQ